MTSALNSQIGGSHYKKTAIQPVQYIHANNLPFIEGNIVKYITRWREKGGVETLEKIKHYVDLLIELEDLNGIREPSKGRADCTPSCAIGQGLGLSCVCERGLPSNHNREQL